MKSKNWVILFFLFPVLIQAQIWEPISFPDTLYSSAINAEKEGVLFVGTGGNNKFCGLFRSYDEGITWEYLPFMPWDYISLMNIKYNQNDVLFVSTNNGLYRSYNDGDDFELIWYPGTMIKLEISPDNILYGLGKYIMRSYDEGTTWDTLYSFPSSTFMDIEFGPNGELFAVSNTFDWEEGRCFHRSLDGGVTWEQIGFVTDLYGLWGVCQNQINELIVGGYWIDTIFVSDDNGSTWEPISELSIDVMESYANDLLISGRSTNSQFGCWFSEDWGQTWVSMVDTVLNPHVEEFSITEDFTVYVQSQNGHGYSHQLFKSINPILGTTEQKKETELTIYPNPASDVVRISGEADKYTIYNLSGQMVKQGKAEESIDVSDLLPGVYIIELDGVRKKLVVE